MFLRLFSAPPSHLSSVFPLSSGSCVGQDDILPDGPVDAIVGRNVTIKTLLNNPAFMVMTWSYSDGAELASIVTVAQGSFKVSKAYVGRVWVNVTNGDLTLGPLKSTDSGDYGISVTFSDLSTKAAEIKLHVLGESFLPVIIANCVFWRFKRCLESGYKYAELKRVSLTMQKIALIQYFFVLQTLTLKIQTLNASVR